MKYLRIPTDVSIAELRANGVSWSAGMYRRVEIPTAETQRVGALLNGYDKGSDPGSLSYLAHSTHYMIRTKALQSDFALICPKGDAITPINPRAFTEMHLTDGDILVSKDSNIGECAMVNGDRWKNHTLSGGIVRLLPATDIFYLFAFLKHPIFKTQLLAKVPRGATLAHANELWLDCLVPFPAQGDSGKVVTYVAALMQAIVEKEQAIRTRHEAGLSAIAAELDAGQSRAFRYGYPTSKQVLEATRMDAGFWSPSLRAQLHRLVAYRHGAWESIYDAGFTTRRGPNLAVSVVGEARYSTEPFGAALPLATPGDVSEYMTIPRFRYYGNRRRVDSVRQGEMILAAKGVREVSIGHTWVNLGDTPFVTNFDSFLIQSTDRTRLVFLAFLFSYLKSIGVFAKLADTSNGGSFVQSHFRALPIPKFEDVLIERVARYYHSPAPAPGKELTLEGFVAWHREWNQELGIWELDRELKGLQKTLAAIQEQIIDGKRVDLPIR